MVYVSRHIYVAPQRSFLGGKTQPLLHCGPGPRPQQVADSETSGALERRGAAVVWSGAGSFWVCWVLTHSDFTSENSSLWMGYNGNNYIIWLDPTYVNRYKWMFSFWSCIRLCLHWENMLRDPRGILSAANMGLSGHQYQNGSKWHLIGDKWLSTMVL